MERPGLDPPRFDPPAALTQMQEWAAMFCDDSSPAQVAEVLVVFALLVGAKMGSVHPGAAAALLNHMEEEMPSASEHVSALVDALAGLRAPSVSGSTRFQVGSLGGLIFGRPEMAPFSKN